MPLNIKNPEVHGRAKDLARIIGKSLSEVVAAAINEAFERDAAYFHRLIAADIREMDVGSQTAALWSGSVCCRCGIDERNRISCSR